MTYVRATDVHVDPAREPAEAAGLMGRGSRARGDLSHHEIRTFEVVVVPQIAE
jgi:hypothetical protein